MSRNALKIFADQAGIPLSPQQKRFNTLIQQIEQARQTLAAWHDSIPSYRQTQAQVLWPLEDELRAAHRQWVFALDELLSQRAWTKTERATIHELVCETAGALLHAHDGDEALKALFARHAGIDFATDRQERMQAMKAMAQAVTGLDLDDAEDAETEGEFFERVQWGLHERAAAEEAERTAAKAAPRRKSSAQQRRDAEAQAVTQSVREVFRKLASALHPDRESDPGQREVKTALMQKVNQAYTANDLLTLLQLQLQIEQIDVRQIAAASAQKLKHYNQVLKEQLSELKAEVEHIEMGFRLDNGLEPGWGLDPRQLGQLLEHHCQQVRHLLREQAQDMHMLADPAATKRWLKRQRQMLRSVAFDF